MTVRTIQSFFPTKAEAGEFVKVLGRVLAGDIYEEVKIWHWYGAGNSGKTTLALTLQGLGLLGNTIPRHNESGSEEAYAIGDAGCVIVITNDESDYPTAMKSRVGFC